ncbi:TPA: hypothetical protein HA278_03645 [Candidatus Woesearchaeota archaeon]|nr:hypothetical protein [archaeon]HIJ11124.1 hypothetical protein [Candidatus Woesearchaeota archaeon]|tara:strand:+ start:369 stop:572 length:204 start_codon:yes stop_codon:yes gene_type:complete
MAEGDPVEVQPEAQAQPAVQPEVAAQSPDQPRPVETGDSKSSLGTKILIYGSILLVIIAAIIFFVLR